MKILIEVAVLASLLASVGCGGPLGAGTSEVSTPQSKTQTPLAASLQPDVVLHPPATGRRQESPLQTLGERRTLVALLSCPDSPLPLTQDQAVARMAEVDSFLRRCSNGQAWLACDYASAALPYPRERYSHEDAPMRLQADGLAALDRQMVLGKYQHIILLVPGDNFNGVAYRGAVELSGARSGSFQAGLAWVWVHPDTSGLGARIAHEFGHTLGFGHSQAYLGTPADPSHPESAQTISYGDQDDVMGGDWCNPGPDSTWGAYNVAWCAQAGWLQNQVNTGSDGNEYDMVAADLMKLGNWGPTALKVSRDGACYWMEWRPPYLQVRLQPASDSDTFRYCAGPGAYHNATPAAPWSDGHGLKVQVVRSDRYSCKVKL